MAAASMARAAAARVLQLAAVVVAMVSAYKCVSRGGGGGGAWRRVAGVASRRSQRPCDERAARGPRGAEAVAAHLRL